MAEQGGFGTAVRRLKILHDRSKCRWTESYRRKDKALAQVEAGQLLTNPLVIAWKEKKFRQWDRLRDKYTKSVLGERSARDTHWGPALDLATELAEWCGAVDLWVKELVKKLPHDGESYGSDYEHLEMRIGDIGKSTPEEFGILNQIYRVACLHSTAMYPDTNGVAQPEDVPVIKESLKKL